MRVGAAITRKDRTPAFIEGDAGARAVPSAGAVASSSAHSAFVAARDAPRSTRRPRDWPAGGCAFVAGACNVGRGRGSGCVAGGGR